MSSTETPRGELVAVIQRLQAELAALTESNCKLSAQNSKLRSYVAYLEGVAYASDGRPYRDIAAVVSSGKVT